jgi:hypothetical protein
VGDDVADWFRMIYVLVLACQRRRGLPVINLKVILNQFKWLFAGSKMIISAFTAAFIGICGKRVKWCWLLLNRNDHMLQGYVKIVAAVVVDAVVGTAACNDMEVLLFLNK